jgi:hypothetical protein
MAKAYTEATHVVYGIGPEEIGVPDAIDLREPSGKVTMQPDAVTLKYHWRTQLGDTTWDTGTAEVVGGVYEDGIFVGRRSTVLYRAADAPAWVAELLTRHAPTRITLTVDTAKARA